MEEITYLKQIKPKVIDMNKPVISLQIIAAENKLAKIVGKRNKDIIETASKDLSNQEGEFNINQLWKLKKQLFPNCKDPPAAVLDTEGNLITDSKQIKKLLITEYKQRLRDRPVRPDLGNIKK